MKEKDDLQVISFFFKSGLMLILAAFLTTFYFISDFQKDEKDHVQIPLSVRWKIGIFYSNPSSYLLVNIINLSNLLIYQYY